MPICDLVDDTVRNESHSTFLSSLALVRSYSLPFQLNVQQQKKRKRREAGLESFSKLSCYYSEFRPPYVSN